MKLTVLEINGDWNWRIWKLWTGDYVPNICCDDPCLLEHRKLKKYGDNVKRKSFDLEVVHIYNRMGRCNGGTIGWMAEIRDL